MDGFGLLVGHLVGDFILQEDVVAANKTRSSAWCALHCTLYTAAVWACAWWMPWWGLLCCWATHFAVDRPRLAGWYMRNVSNQRAFAEGPLAPWSIVVVDQSWHLLILLVIAKLAGR